MRHDNRIWINGIPFTVVAKEKYLLCEKIRNYILRRCYEESTPQWIAIAMAAKKFGVSQTYAKDALRYWKAWCFENAMRHKPLEDYIEQDKKIKQRKQ